MTKEDIHFDLTKNDDWFDIKLLIDCKKLGDIKQFIHDETYQNKMKPLKKLKIFSTHLYTLDMKLDLLKCNSSN